MKPSDIFGVVVRTIGLCLMLYALWYLLFAVAEVGGILAEQSPGEERVYFLNGLGALIVALFLMRGGRRITRFSYPGEDKGKDDAA